MTGNVITVKGRLWSPLNPIAAGAVPLLLSTDPKAMENDGESLRDSILMVRSPGLFLLLLFLSPSAEIQSFSHGGPWAPWYCLPSQADSCGLLGKGQIY